MPTFSIELWPSSQPIRTWAKILTRSKLSTKTKCLVFASHDAAVESVENGSENNFCPLIKARPNKASMTKTNVKTHARRNFKCSHGIKYSANWGVPVAPMLFSVSVAVWVFKSLHRTQPITLYSSRLVYIKCLNALF